MGFDFDPLASDRREYGEHSLNEQDMASSPFDQFDRWFKEVSETEIADLTAMVLSTVDAKGRPNSRVVLLKGIENGAFIFFTNYESAKGQELLAHPFAALNFYWPTLVRQVRIRGPVKRLSRGESEAYFKTRSLMSQCSAIVSPQSHEISSRELLVEKANALYQQAVSSEGTDLKCPKHWGGYALFAEEIEFWQGRNYRLHDRILYVKKTSKWIKSRLAS